MSKISIAKHCLLAGGAAAMFVLPAGAQQLDRAMQVAKSSTAASAASQQRVADYDDEADAMALEYRALLQQVDNIQIFVDRQDVHLASQAQEIASLNNQLATVEAVKQGMSPMMLRMTIAIEDSIEADLPFELEKRRARVRALKDALANPNVSPVEQYRKVLNVYDIEVSFGYGINSYEGRHPDKAGVKVNYLRYGRVALLYMTKDGSEIKSCSLKAGKCTWVDVSKKHANQVRKAIRIAKEQAAPDMIMAPIVKQN